MTKLKIIRSTDCEPKDEVEFNPMMAFLGCNKNLDQELVVLNSQAAGLRAVYDYGFRDGLLKGNCRALEAVNNLSEILIDVELNSSEQDKDKLDLVKELVSKVLDELADNVTLRSDQ